MLIKGKKFMFYIKDMSGNWKFVFGNIEHLHGDERCRFCVVKDYSWVFSSITVSKNCVVNKLFNVVIGLGYVQKCLIWKLRV